METVHHSASEEWLLKTLVERGDNEFTEKLLKEKSVHFSHWKQSDFLKYLLLTGNEIDLKKVLCLHLFAITVPPTPCKRGDDQTHMKIYEFTNYTFFLPNYYLHKQDEGQLYCPCWEKENALKSGKLRSYDTHLAVNATVVNVITSVMKVLTTIDNNLLKTLVSMSHSIRFINKLLRDEYYKSYITTLWVSGVFHDKDKLRTEKCTIIRATSQLVSEVAHIKKNMVFSILMPDFLSEKVCEIQANVSEKKRNVSKEEENTLDPQQSTHHYLHKSTNSVLRNLNLKDFSIYDNKKTTSCANYIVNCKLSEDNNKIVQFTTYSFALPNFFLHHSTEEKFYCKCWYKENKEKIGKLIPCKIHMAVNVAVVEIIETALEVLNNFNKFALEKLITMSHDLSAIKSCLSDKQYVDYIAGLCHYGIFKNVWRLRTEVCTIIKATPKLMGIAHIKKNMVLSLKVPDIVQSPNNFFLIRTTNKTALEFLESQLEEKNSINIEKQEEIKGVEIKSYIKKFSKTVPRYNSTTIKRWPFTNEEINIGEELKQLEGIKDNFIKKYDINSTDKIEIKNINTLPDSSSFEKKKRSNEETTQSSIKLDSKSNVSASTSKSPSEESKYKNAFQQGDAKSEKVLFEHKSAQFREKNWIKYFSKQREKELNRKDTCDISKSDINKLISIDRTHLKNSLLKVEFRLKLRKLISSIDGTLVEN